MVRSNQRQYVVSSGLPWQLGLIASRSNIEKHESARRWARNEVSEALQQCLGVQTEGLLWRLAQLKRALLGQALGSGTPG